MNIIYFFVTIAYTAHRSNGISLDHSSHEGVAPSHIFINRPKFELDVNHIV